MDADSKELSGEDFAGNLAFAVNRWGEKEGRI
jgi:hypothetical protein